MNFSSLRPLATSLVFFGSMFTACAAPPQRPVTETVDTSTREAFTQSGPIIGQTLENATRYLGIPYAAPPIGDLRWKPTQQHAGWTTTLKAEEVGAACMQPQIPGRTTGATRMDEDCLFMNIWAPKDAKGDAPVMVWIHGGAFRLGSGTQAYFDGEAFAESGVVLVTFNYRLGHFGFFAHPALQQPGDTANFALTDQIQALNWVKQNISAFGGDADNVTIFGESAGGVSVLDLMGSKPARGLFDKAIVQSGGGWQPKADMWAARMGKPASIDAGVTWAKTRGLSGSDVSADQLRALPAEQVLGGEMEQGAGWGPVIDGVILTEDIRDAFAKGNIARVPLIIGANSFEASLMEAFKVPPRAIIKATGDKEAEAREIYNAKTDKALAEALYGDASFVAPARDLARKAASHDLPVWLYHFDYRATKRSPGAKHGLEILFVFKTTRLLAEQRPLLMKKFVKDAAPTANDIHAYWVNFARQDNPNGNGLVNWPAYGNNSDWTLLFEKTQRRAMDGFLKARLDLHEELLQTRQAAETQ